MAWAGCIKDVFRRNGGHLAWPAAATACCFALILLGGWLAGFLPAAWLGNWTEHIARLQPHWVDRFFPFDALWYERIAADAYVWDAAHPDVKQDVAFFPLWPLVLRGVGFVVRDPVAARWGAVGCAGAFGFASVVFFRALAWKVLRPEEAVAATWLFALYPGASFLLLSYPTGLMNLLCCLAMLAALQGRYWLGALCAGLVTASGPLGLGTAMAVWLCAARARGAAAFVSLVAMGVLSISGLVGFLLWQYGKFGNGLAFVAAQGAWAAPLPWLARIPRVFVQVLIAPDFVMALAYGVHALWARSLVAMQAGLEKSLHSAALGLALLMLVLAWRRLPLVLRLQGACTLALFIWFHSTSRPANSTIRLTYCVLTTFLGLGIVLAHRPVARRCVMGLFAILLCGATFLSAAGYHVT
jgi:hypothetical protein